MVAAAAPIERRAIVMDYWPRGGSAELWRCRDGEILLDGPAGTGKTRGCLQKLHQAAINYPGMRGLMVRKVFEDLKGSAMVTFAERIRPDLDGVTFFGGSKERDAGYYYPNGSFIGVAGLDKPTKVMSKEFDMVYVVEATEVTETDWENITTRLRNGVMPYQQLIADCNPGPQNHWLNLRCNAGRTKRILSRHEDNPMLFDPTAGEWTDFGKVYIGKLDALTGVRYLRLRQGVWASAEGIVYEEWDPALHLIDAFEIPKDWPRYLIVDFGYTNPFVCQWWAQDGDGRLYRYREVYMTGRLVEEHAAHILQLHGKEPKPRMVITDHDAEDRGTFEKHTGWKTTAAAKEVKAGVDAVKARLKKAGDGKPRLYFVRGARVEFDQSLRDAGKPTCTEEEFDTYIWDTRPAAALKEHPMKEDDHGMDCVRYLCRTLDGKPEKPKIAAVPMPHVSTWS